MLNFFKTKTFKVGTFVFALALGFALSASAYDFGTTTLKVGSKGAYVSTLQTLVGANADGNFGPMTKAAVKAWQAANGLTADGVFGPLSMAKANAGGSVSGNFPAGCTSASGFSTTTGQACVAIPSTVAGCTSGALFSSTTGQSCATTVAPGALAGTDGTLSDFSTMSQYNNTEIGAGQTDVKIYGFDAKASKEGDIVLKSIKTTFTLTNASGSVKLADYVGSVSVWAGSTKVGTANASDFNKDSSGIYSKTITLDSSSIVRADSTTKFYVTVTPLSNLDSGDIDSETAVLAIDNVRYADGSGVVTTETLTGDLPVSAFAMKFVDFSTSSDTELKVSTNNTPAAGVIKVSSTNDTKGVVLLKGKLKLEGTSKVWLDEMPISFTATGATAIDALTGNVYLTIGGNTYSESTGSNCVNDATDYSTTENCNASLTAGVVFDDLDLTLAAGSTTEFTVSADLNDTETTGVQATDFEDGDTLLASLTTGARYYIIAENAAGDQLVDATEVTGSAIGNAQQFYAIGTNIVMGTPTITPTTNSTTGEVTAIAYSIPMSVTSFGNTLYLGQTAQNAAATSASNAFAFVFQNSGAPAATDSSVTVSGITLETSDATIDTNGYTLDEGVTKHFTIKATLTAGTNNTSYRVQVKQIQTFSNANLGLTGTAVSLSPDVSFRTGFQLLNN